MFALGIEFSLRELWKVRALALIGAPFGVAVITGLMAALMVAAGASLASGLVTGLALAVCSTMALAKLLLERGDLNGPVGRVSIGISLSQDGVVVVAFFLLADRLVPAVLGRIAHAQNTELFLLVAVTIGIGTAALSAGLGLSLALGAFLAGLVISESEYTTETLARVLPLRDLFVAVFFVLVARGTACPAAADDRGRAARQGRYLDRGNAGVSEPAPGRRGRVSSLSSSRSWGGRQACSRQRCTAPCWRPRW